MTTLVAIVPLGYLDRHGYQYHTETCLGSFAEAVDHVFAICTVPGQTVPLMDNLTILDVPESHFSFVAGELHYDLRRVIMAWQGGLDCAWDEGFDTALLLSVTNYIPVGARAALRHKAETMLLEGDPFDWTYRRLQLGGTLYQSSVRDPYLINLHEGAQMSLQADCIWDSIEGTVGRVYGHYPAFDQEAIVDVPLELTEADLAAKMTFLRNLHEYSSKRPVTYSWEWWQRYYAAKFSGLVATEDPLDEYGRNIAAQTRPDFVSHQIGVLHETA